MSSPLLRRVRARLIRRGGSAATCLLLILTSLQMGAPAAAAAAPAGSATQATAPQAGGGQPFASKSKPAPTEVPSLRSTYSNTYDNHDGTFTAQASTGPINYLAPGSKIYQPIDATLAAMPGKNGRVRASHMATPVEVGAPDDASGFLSIDTGEGVIRMHLAPGASPGKRGSQPTTHGSQADVSGLMPNMDLRASVDTVGVHTYFVLNSIPSTSSFTIALSTAGLTPYLRGDGSILFLNSRGATVSYMPAPYATDSAHNGNSGSGNTTYKVYYSLDERGSQYLLTVTVNAVWLADATYPVYVDPTIVSGAALVWNNTVSAANYLQTYQDHINTPNREFLVGYDGASQWAAYLKFNLAGAGIPAAYVTAASLTLLPYWQWYTSAETTYVSKVTTSWSPTNLYWNNAPFHSNPYSPATITTFNSYRNSVVSFNLPLSTVQGWASTPSSNYGLYLYGLQNSTTGWKRFIDSQDTTGAQKPSLSITYTLPAVTASSPTGNAWTNSRTLSWAYTNPSGLSQTKSQVQVATDSGFTNKIYDSNQVSNTAASYAIPTGTTLTDGTSYYWRVQAFDSFGWSAWSSGQFHWDAGAPAAPTITAPTGVITYLHANSYGYAWNAVTDLSGIDHYEVVPESAPVASPGVCSDSWSAMTTQYPTGPSLTLSGLVTNTCYHVGVRAHDNAGNSSDLTYSPAILVDNATPAAPVVTDDCAAIGSCYRSGNTIYFQPDAATTITLTSSGVATPSGIDHSTFGPLSDETGWTYEPGDVSGDEATMTLTWSADALETSLSVTLTNQAGTTSAETAITFVPDSGAKVGFATPVSGTATSALAPGHDQTVEWTETPGLSAVTARSLQRQTEAANSDGSCPADSWQADGDPSSAESPVVVSGLVTGACYRWVETLTDSLGTHDFVSAPVYVDAVAPTAAIAAPGAGQTATGTLEVTGTASDTYFAGFSVEFGSGASPESWTSIASSETGVAPGGTLASWTTGSLTGLYTLRLTVTDAAGNATVVTRTIYLDNTHRDSGAHASGVPFDLGGGWNLSVNVASGEAALSRGLYSIPSFGPRQSLSIAYNSADTGTAGRLGRGWSSNLTQYLDLSALGSGYIVWHRADGSIVPFGQINGAWVPLAGHYEALTAVEGGYRITATDTSYLSFNGTGALVAMTDRYGVSLLLSWGDGSATATDAGGHSSAMVLDTAGRITSVTDSAGRAWSFTYTDANLTRIADPAGNATDLGYDASGRLTGVTRDRTAYGASAPASVVWGIAYDGASGRVAAVVDPIGGAAHQATFTYGEGYAAGTTTVVRPRAASGSTPASTILYNLDPAGRGWVTSVVAYATAADDPDALSWTMELQYDASGNMTSERRQIDADSWASASWTYTGWGAVATETGPAGVTTTNTYSSDAFHDLLTRTVSGGTHSALTAYVYDARHRLCREVANPTVDPATIDCTGSLPVSASDRNVDHRYAYDDRNEMTSQIDPMGIVTTYAYDDWGNQTDVTVNYLVGVPADESANVHTHYTYDTAGNVTSQTRPINVAAGVSATIAFTYDTLGNGLSETDPGDASIPAVRSLSTYDEFGAKTSSATQVCVAGESSCTWTTLSISTSVYDALGHATATTVITPATDTTPQITATTTYQVDLAGDVLSVTSPGGVISSATFDALGEALTETASGGTTYHTYDGLGRETRTVSPGSGLSTLTTDRTYDLGGNVTRTAVTDSADGSVSTTTGNYDDLGRLHQTTSPNGTVTTQTYDAMSRVVTSVSGTTETDTAYDPNGNVVLTTGPYDPSDPDGARPSTVSTYDGLGRVTSTSTAAGTTRSYYDAAGNVIAGTSPDGSVNRSLYNIRGGLTKSIANCTDAGTTHPADPPSCTGSGTADTATNLVTTIAYGPTGGKILQQSYVAGVESDTSYDGSGRTLSTTVDVGGLNLTTLNAYDGSGRLVATRDPAGVVTITAYNSNGRAARTIANCVDATPPAVWSACSGTAGFDGTRNLVTAYEYDDAGNTTNVIAPDGTITHYTYDAEGHVWTEVQNYVAQYGGADPTVNVTTTYSYDTSGRQILATAPNGAKTATVYDTDGNVCRTIDNATIDPATLAHPCTDAIAGRTASANIDTQISYDAAGNKTRVVVPSPADGATPTNVVITLYAYDAAQRLCRVVENASPSLDLAALAHPCTDAISGQTNTANVETRYEYDAAGNMTAQYTPNGTGGLSVTTFAYDALARITATTDPDGNVEGANPAAHTTTWTYDAAGNQASQTEPDGSKTFWFYDAAARLCRRVSVASGAGYTLPAHPCTDTGGVSGAAVDTIYTNDPAGNMTSATNALTGEAISATYDALARPMAVSHSGGPIADPGTTYGYGIHNLTRTDPSGAYSFGLDAAGRQTSLIDPLHTSAAYGWSYEASGQLYSVTDPTANVTAYAHDPLGRVLSISVSGASGCAVCVLLSYSYNAASSQIGTESTISGDPANGSIAYGYDPLGRLASYAPGAAGIEHQAYGWAALPDRTSITRGTADPVTTVYDAASRPVSDASHSSDAQGRVTKTPGSHPGEVLTLSWDPLGRLTGVSSSLGTSTTYTYDPLDRLETVSSGGTVTSFLYVGLTDAVAQVGVTASGNTVTTNHATDLAGTELFEWVSGSDPLYLGRNLHSDVVWTYGPSGAPASHATYDPFGNLVASTGTVPATRWQSSWQDSSTGLYYVIARWYDPVSGAFLSTDPLAGVMSDPQSLDRYAYGAGDPVGSLDTSGQCSYDANTHTFSGTNCPSPPVTKPPVRRTLNPRIARDPEPKITTTATLPPLMLNTSVVAQFSEPGASYWGDPNSSICGAGALRVVLAFAGYNPNWTFPQQWVRDSDGYGGHWGPATPTYNGGPDTATGWRYMSYLAYNAKPPDLYLPYWLNATQQRPAGGTLVGDNHYNYDNPPARVAQIANWEYSGWGKITKYVSNSPFYFVKFAAEKDMVRVITNQLWFKHVPVQIAVTTRLPNGTRLPSWTAAIGHYVAIVGYDKTNFYYIDTCNANCRAPNSGPWWSPTVARTDRPGVWRVPMHDMWLMEQDQGRGLLAYGGPPSFRETGW